MSRKLPDVLAPSAAAAAASLAAAAAAKAEKITLPAALAASKATVAASQAALDAEVERKGLMRIQYTWNLLNEVYADEDLRILCAEMDFFPPRFQELFDTFQALRLNFFEYVNEFGINSKLRQLNQDLYSTYPEAIEEPVPNVDLHGRLDRLEAAVKAIRDDLRNPGT